MKRLIVLGTVVCVLLLAAYGGITLYDEYFPFGRMWETPAVKPHEIPIQGMRRGSVPATGGEAVWRTRGSGELENPDPDRSAKRVFSGRTAYVRYCIHCHGKALDGQGTVGQSFSPLPRDLRSPRIQDQSDGALFFTVSYGKNRMPALAATLSVPERWDVIVYLRTTPENNTATP